MSTFTYSNDCLSHHGISGQKWGVRNGPPYPLDYEAHSQREKKYGTEDWAKKAQRVYKKQRKAAESRKVAAKSTYADRKKNDEIYRKDFKEYSKEQSSLGGLKSKIAYGNYARQMAVNEATSKLAPNAKVKDPLESGMSERTKKIIKTSLIVGGTALAAYGSYKIATLIRDLKSDNLLYDSKTGLPLLDKKLTDEQILNRINPGKIRLGLSSAKNVDIAKGSSTNCMLCTTSYDLMKRGYDVRAGLDEILPYKPQEGWLPSQLFPRIYKNYTGTKGVPNLGNIEDLYTQIIKTCLDQGSDGSRGNIIVHWKTGGGHSMIWENVKGNIVFRDGQTGITYSNFKEQILKHVSLNRDIYDEFDVKRAPVGILRTDNLELNGSFISEVMNTGRLYDFYKQNADFTEVIDMVGNTADLLTLPAFAIVAAANSADYKRRVSDDVDKKTKKQIIKEAKSYL